MAVVTVVKTRVTHTYTGATGTVIFKPDPASLAEQGLPITTPSVRKNLVAGVLTVDVATGIEDGSELGVIYDVSVLINGGMYQTRRFLIPVSATPIDLESLIPVAGNPEAGRFVFPARDIRPGSPKSGEAFYNPATGDTEYWNDVTQTWIGLSLSVGSPPVGAAGGVLTGTYPNPGLAANSVGTSQLKTDSVTADKLSQEYVTRNTYLADLDITAAALAELDNTKLDKTATNPVKVLEFGQSVPGGTAAGTVIFHKTS